MLDTLLSRLKEEIAIDGTSGSSIDAVWKYAESISNQVAKESDISIKPKIDGPYKAFVWNYIKQEPELSFFEETGTSAQENQINNEDVPMEEQQQQQGPVDQDQHDITMAQQQQQSEDVADMETTPGDNGIVADTEDSPSGNHVIDMLHEAQLKDKPSGANMYFKRKSKAALKKSAPKKKKTKSAPKKKKTKKPAKKKKRVSAGHSDSDFEMDSDDSESEYDASDISEASSEEYSTEGDEDVSDQDDHPKSSYTRKYPVVRKNEDILSNPRNVQPKARKDNTNLTAIQDIEDLSYDQVQERYGSRLRIIASARLQDEQLYLGVPPDANITPSLVVILREIIKTRTRGLYQASITRLLDLDSRSTGHYAKSLEDKGAITRRGVSINSMYTNICVHARYSIESNEVDMNTVGDKEAENELPYNVNGHGKVFSQKALLDVMVDLALAAPNGLILSQDVLHGLGFNSTRKAVRKWFNRSIDELCLKGYFEKANIKLDGSRHHRCLHLLKVPEDYEARQASDEPTIVPVDELSFPIKIKTTRNHGIPIHHLLCDVPLESQILDVITAAGTQGAVQKDISIALNLDEMRFLSKALEKLAELKPGEGYEQYGVVRYFEFEGRVRRYRYFTLAASIKVNENRDYVPPPLPEAETDESKYYERTIFFPIPHNKSGLGRYRKMIKRAGHRNVNYTGAAFAGFSKRKLNPDGTPRPKSRYILGKEKKIAAMIAAEKAAAEASVSADPSSRSSGSTAEPSSTATDSPAPAHTPTNKEIHSFFKEARTRKAAIVMRPPSPTPVPAPVISQNRLACPAFNADDKRSALKAKPNARAAPATETQARKKQKRSAKENTAVAQEATSVPEVDAAATSRRTTRSGRAIPYEVEPEAPSSEPPVANESSDISVASDSQSTTQMDDTSQPASSERVDAEDLTATEKSAASTSESAVQALPSEASSSESSVQATPSEASTSKSSVQALPSEASTAENSVQAAPSEASASESSVQASLSEASTSESQSPPADAAPSKVKPKPSRSQTPTKPSLPRLRNRSIADYFKAPPKKTTPPIAATPSAKASSSTAAATPPVEASSSTAAATPPVKAILTKTKPKERKTVTFAETVLEHPLEPEQSSTSSPLAEAVEETPTVLPENEAAETPTSNGDTEETANKDGPAQADVADMEVDASESTRSASTAPNEAPENQASATTRITRSRSATVTPPPAAETEGDPASATTTTKDPVLFRRYQHEKAHKPINSYLEMRIKILYEILEDLRLVEMGKLLTQEFEDRAAVLNKNSKYKVDGKTLWSTALALEKRGQAQTVIIPCTLLSGKTVMRRVLFHRDMSQDSEEYKRYITFIKERRTGVSYRNLPKPVAEVNQVVRLSDQVEQMQKEAQELLVSGQIKKAKQMELRINELSRNLETFGREYGKTNNTYWMIEAVQYGWINASMARAKIFHRYLLRLLEANVDGVNQETRVISLNAVCDNMSFQLLAQVIGVFKPTRLIAEFYKDPENHKVKMMDMSDQLKRDLFDENTKFLRRLKKLFNILEYIQILTGQFTEVKDNPNFQATKYGHIAPAYRLEETVPIIDRKQAEEPVLRTYTIKTTDEFNEYWADLKYVSTARNVDKFQYKKLDNSYEIELRSSMHSPRNWSTRSVFTRAQRKLLNERVDKVNRKTPLSDPYELRTLAVQFNMPTHAIQAYYEKVDAALERRHLYTKEKKLEKLVMGGKKRRQAARTKYNIYGGRRVITGDSNHAFVGTRRQPSKATKSYMDDLQNLPVVQGDVLKSLVRRRRKRHVWNEQDDEILLYMFTILRHRSRKNRVKISWVPAQKVFPDRETHSCRHRKDKMLSQSVFSEKYELYLIYWDTFYREGIERGDISDPDPDDNINVDILSYVEYFVRRLQELDENPVDLPLPRTLAQTNDMYHITRNEASTPYFEDAFHDGDSLIHRLQTLHQAPFTLRTYMDTHYDQSDATVAVEGDAIKRLWSLIRIYCLMTLMTPSEVFDPFHAYQILSRFPQPAMDAVFERMKAERTLISADGDRPIPGTSWALSAKFIKDMSGELPVDLFNQAKEYEKFLATQNHKFKFMPLYASSGMMACLLNALSDNQILFSLTNLNLQLRKVKEVGFRTRGIGNSILMQLGVDIQRNLENHIMADIPTVSQVNIKQLTNKEYDVTLSNLLISQNDKESALIKAVIHALHEQHEVGLTLYQLKMKLQEHHHHHFSDGDIVQTVRRLCYNKPALVCRVGFDAVRFVHIKFASSWTINNKETQDHIPSDRAKQEIMRRTNGQFQTGVVKQDIVVPSLWIDINGNVTDLVLNGCKRAIVDLVLRKPGISESHIHRHMVTGLSKREVHDVLDILVEEQALRRIQVQTLLQQQASRPSIFAKKTLVKCSSTDSIGRLTHSCFWVTPKIFSSV